MSDSRGHYKQEAYEQAIAFRKRGFTYTEIAKICGVSRGTVSAWLAKEPFSQAITVTNMARAAKSNSERIKLVNKARKAERGTHYAAALKAAEVEFRHYRASPLFVSGLTIYESLGDCGKTPVIRLSSGKMQLQARFVRFAVDYLGADPKLVRFWLLLYPTHDEVFLMKRWAKVLKLSVGQFYKNQIITPRGGHTTGLQFGVGNTIIGNTLLKKKLLHWIKLLEKEVK